MESFWIKSKNLLHSLELFLPANAVGGLMDILVDIMSFVPSVTVGCSQNYPMGYMVGHQWDEEKSMPIQYKGGIMHMPSGVKVTYRGNVLYCNRHRTPEENFASIRVALCHLTGLTEEILFGRIDPYAKSNFEEDGGKFELYRTMG